MEFHSQVQSEKWSMRQTRWYYYQYHYYYYDVCMKFGVSNKAQKTLVLSLQKSLLLVSFLARLPFMFPTTFDDVKKVHTNVVTKDGMSTLSCTQRNMNEVHKKVVTKFLPRYAFPSSFQSSYIKHNQCGMCRQPKCVKFEPIYKIGNSTLILHR